MLILPQTFFYVLLGQKADWFFNSNTILIACCHNAPNLYAWFIWHLTSCDVCHLAQSLLWLWDDGSILMCSWFLSHLHTHLPAFFVGHSLCFGGATFFTSMEWPDNWIQACGQWSSDAFKIYIQKNPVLLQALLYSQPAAATIKLWLFPFNLITYLSHLHSYNNHTSYTA